MKRRFNVLSAISGRRFAACLAGASVVAIALGAQKAAGAAPAAPQASGGGSASAEAQARMYLALAGATNNVADQLLGRNPKTHEVSDNYKNPLPGISTYILYDPRMNADMATAASFKVPLDGLYFEIYKTYGTSDGKPAKNHMFALPLAGLLAGISLPGVISTLSSIAGISTSWVAMSVSASGVAGTTDADAFIASHLNSQFRTLTSGKTNVYAPSMFPLLTTGEKAYSSLANRGAAGLTPYDTTNCDPVTEFNLLQGDVLFLLKQEQANILGAYKSFCTATAPVPMGATTPPPTVAAAYTTLVNDLRAAITWTPSAAGTSPSPSGTPAGSSAGATVLPYAAVQADMQALLAAIGPAPKGGGDSWKDLRDALNTLIIGLPAPTVKDLTNPDLQSGAAQNLDSTVQIAQALSTIGSTLGTQVQPYGTVNSGTPGAASPDTIGNIVIRGWQIARLLSDKSCAVLRVHLEMSQGTDKTTSYAVKWFKDSSAMALLSFMVFGTPSSEDFSKLPAAGDPTVLANLTDNIKFSSWAMAYYPFQNADDALNIDNLQVISPPQYMPSITLKGHTQR